MKKIFLSLITILVSIPLVSEAHVKWFAEAHTVVRPYQFTDIPVLISVLIGFQIFLVGLYLERVLKVPKWYQRFIEKYAPNILSIASIGFGLSYLIFSYMGFIFAPNLPATGETGAFLLIIQTIAGLMILFGFFERIGGLLLILLFILASRVYGFTEMMDTFEMLGFAVYAMIIGRPKWRIVESHMFSKLMHVFHKYGVSILRIGTGINLIILGFSEKILVPGLTQAFLLEYPWNFMKNIGFSWYTDYWFAYSAGFVEMLFGVFILMGLVTRVTIIALAVFLVSTLVLLGPIELIGHLPHFSIAAVLLVFGAGSAMHMKKN
jgi:uncharacterized membrane protein YphA (DoxX/SURF4 family)